MVHPTGKRVERSAPYIGPIQSEDPHVRTLFKEIIDRNLYLDDVAFDIGRGVNFLRRLKAYKHPWQQFYFHDFDKLAGSGDIHSRFKFHC